MAPLIRTILAELFDQAFELVLTGGKQTLRFIGPSCAPNFCSRNKFERKKNLENKQRVSLKNSQNIHLLLHFQIPDQSTPYFKWSLQLNYLRPEDCEYEAREPLSSKNT